MRESTIKQENDWIAKNRKHLKKHGMFASNLQNNANSINSVENNPLYLKSKGDELYRNSDYYSAINYYSNALDMDEELTGCYSNRSICYLSLNMFDDCVDDCQIAIKQIESKLSDNICNNNNNI